MADIVVLLGPTGAGKSVQGDILAKELGWVHLSSGELLRQDPKMRQYLTGGGLAPSDEVNRVIGEAISKVPADRPIVIDGFPRMLDEAKWLGESQAGSGHELKQVILLEVAPKITGDRLSRRGRGDDSDAAQAAKWRWYQDEVGPVIEYYRQHGKLKVVDGSGTIEEVKELIRGLL